MLPPEYNALCNNVVNLVNNYVGDVDRQIKAKNDKLRDSLATITSETMNYIETGIVHSTRNWVHIESNQYGVGWGHSGFSWETYFRRVAKQMGRPYVEVNKGYGRTTIKFPKRKYLDPLVAPLLLAPDRFCNNNNCFTTLWCFVVQAWDPPAHPGEDCAEGNQFINEWLHRCATDPDCRKALRLT